jgi:hypothetical protein
VVEEEDHQEAVEAVLQAVHASMLVLAQAGEHSQRPRLREPSMPRTSTKGLRSNRPGNNSTFTCLPKTSYR